MKNEQTDQKNALESDPKRAMNALMNFSLVLMLIGVSLALYFG